MSNPEIIFAAGMAMVAAAFVVGIIAGWWLRHGRAVREAGLRADEENVFLTLPNGDCPMCINGEVFASDDMGIVVQPCPACFRRAMGRRPLGRFYRGTESEAGQ